MSFAIIILINIAIGVLSQINHNTHYKYLMAQYLDNDSEEFIPSNHKYIRREKYLQIAFYIAMGMLISYIVKALIF